MDAIKSKADAFSQSYGRAMEMSLRPNASRAECAAAVAKHYKEGMYSFAFGAATRLEDAMPGVSQAVIVEQHLERFEKAGFGWRIKLVKHEVMPYSPGSAQCWLTWEIEPANEVKGWQWTNIYAFRLPPDGKGGLAEEGFWEYAVSDQEIGNLVERCPNFWEL